LRGHESHGISSISPYIPTPVLHEKRLYCITEDGMALCQNAETGKLIYEERLPLKSASGARSRPYYASTILADGKLYVPSRKGGVFVLKAGDSFEVLQQNQPLDPSDFNATPAVVEKELYLRSNNYLYCLEER
jgi:outer membrane protein assembly factor BamB